MLAPRRFLATVTPPLLLPLLLALVLTLLAAAAHAQAPAGFKAVPPLRAHVTDEIGMLAPEQRQQLEQRLADYEAKTGNQIAVLLVGSTEPEAIEQYSIRVADAWKLGRKGVDDGVLLLVARDNPTALRRLRIEAGRGVQGVLTDAQSKRVLQDVIAPHFRDGDWYGGLAAGTGAIQALLNHETFPAPAQPSRGQASQADGNSVGSPLAGIFFAFVIVLTLRNMFRRPGQRFGRPGQRGSAWDSGVAGVIVGSMLGSGRGGGGGGGFGGGSGGGFSGGGFSGGGGSFDGGGASGDW